MASSVPSDTSVLFETDHGSVERTTQDRVRLRFGSTSWILASSDVPGLRDTTRSLASEVYHCERDCRWQLRVDGHPTVVLDSDEVLRLDALLDGAVTMLELDTILDGASISRPVVA
ncbi:MULTISPECIES: citrate synthase [Salinibacter]|uniref:citrate synthase n=1 Tax=Salinibacter TaxID=146918 RepID=UPI0021E8DE30|nr:MULTISPECIES: citrate synthase [Salinibacter]